jgi:hypothetical protein
MVENGLFAKDNAFPSLLVQSQFREYRQVIRREMPIAAVAHHQVS